MKYKQFFLFIVATFLLLPSVRPQESTDNVTVYFYRLRDGYGAMFKPSIFVDLKQVVRMRNGRFLQTSIAPGPHVITSTFPGNGLSVELKAGQTYYFRLNMTRATFLHNTRGEVTGVLPEQGKFEVSQLKVAEPEDLKADPEPVK